MPLEPSELTLMLGCQPAPARLVSRAVGLSLGSKPVAVQVVPRELVLTTGPEMDTTVLVPELVSWIFTGTDLGFGLGALARVVCVTNVTCEVQFLFVNPAPRGNSYATERSALSTNHNVSTVVTDNEDRGVPLEMSWRWWYGVESSAFTYIQDVIVPEFGNPPTEERS